MSAPPPTRHVKVSSRAGAAWAIVRESLLHPGTETEIEITNVKPEDTSNYGTVRAHSRLGAALKLVKESLLHPTKGDFIVIEPASNGSRVIAGSPEIVTWHVYGVLEMAAAMDPSLTLVTRGNDYFMVARLSGQRVAKIRITGEADPETSREWYETNGSSTVLRSSFTAMKFSWSIEGGKPREQRRLAKALAGWLEQAERELAEYQRQLAPPREVGAA